MKSEVIRAINDEDSLCLGRQTFNSAGRSSTPRPRPSGHAYLRMAAARQRQFVLLLIVAAKAVGTRTARKAVCRYRDHRASMSSGESTWRSKVSRNSAQHRLSSSLMALITSDFINGPNHLALEGQQEVGPRSAVLLPAGRRVVRRALVRLRSSRTEHGVSLQLQ